MAETGENSTVAARAVAAATSGDQPGTTLLATPTKPASAAPGSAGGSRTGFQFSAVGQSRSLSLTWWLCSACHITSPTTTVPRSGRVASRGIEMTSAGPTASGMPLTRMKTPD